MSRRRLVVVAVLALAAALAAALLPRGHEPLPGIQTVGSTAPRTQITFVLSLKINERLLDRDVAAGLPAAGASELGRRYGLPLADERAVTRILAANGIDVLATYPQRTEIDARASARVLGRFFGVRYRDYVDPLGERFHAPGSAPSIPASLRPFVTGVVGLSTRSLAVPADLPHGALRPTDAAQAYDVDPLHAQGIDGSGQTIAILSLERFPDDVSETQDDIGTFRGTFKASGPKPIDVKVDGGGNDNDLGEDLLDIDVISAIAPGAQIINYEAPKTASGNLDLFNRLVADGRATIASFSWGICDSRLPAEFRARVQDALKLAVRRGITVFVASGDSGSYDCQRSNFSDHSLSVDFPADQAQVVSVGGTLLDVGSDGSYFREAGWEDALSNGGGGGGINVHDPAPAWQVANHVSQTHRVVPDVSASASSSSGWLVRDYGSWDAFGGTSAAAPFWAASMLLAKQLAAKQDVKRQCFLAPILYHLAYTKQPYPPFHDVTRGGNRFYPAGRGWDYATGLGSPDVYNLARDLVAYLRTHTCSPA